MLSYIQEKIVEGSHYIRIPRGKGATYAVVMGAFGKLGQGNTVLVIGESLLGFKMNLEKEKVDGVDITYSEDLIEVNSNFKNLVGKILFTADRGAIININKIYEFIYVDGIRLYDCEKELLKCIAKDYCIVESYDLSIDPVLEQYKK